MFSGVALKDVVKFIRDAIATAYEDNTISAFTQKSITDMYNDRLIHHGSRCDSNDVVAFSRNTHAARVREKIQGKSRVFALQRKVEK